MAIDADTLIDRAIGLNELGRFEEAVPLLLQALAQDPEDAWVLCHLARTHLRMGDAESARRYAEKSIHANPSEEWGHRLLGVTLQNLGQAEAALDALEEARRLEPENPEVLLALTSFHFDQKQIDEAETAAQELRRLDPDRRDPYLALARVALNREDWPETERQCRQALEIEPDDLDGLYWLGISLARQNRDVESIEVMHQAVRTDPSNLTVRKLLQELVDAYIGRSWPIAIVAIFFPGAWLGYLWELLIGKRRRRRKLSKPVQEFVRQRARIVSALSRWQFLLLISLTTALFWSAFWQSVPDMGPSGPWGWGFYVGSWGLAAWSLREVLLWFRRKKDFL